MPALHAERRQVLLTEPEALVDAAGQRAPCGRTVAVLELGK